MWGFPRSKSKPRPAVRPTDTLEGASDLLSGWLKRMQDLGHARRLATPPARVAIDEEMDQVCQDVAEEVEKTGREGVSERIRRMKRLTLNEVLEMRDKARRENG
jgi:hypothetical protein